ncbi:MAG: homoserine dehydrogenase [Pseudomonadota bacterium]
MSTPFRIAIAGLGTVGAGTVRLIAENADLLAARAGRRIEIAAVSARTRSADRGVDLAPFAWEDDPAALAGRGDVDAVVEVIGGVGGAGEAAVRAALAAGKPVVTANKALMAEHGLQLAKTAEAAGVALRFEAAVAGGIPVIKALSEGLAANRTRRIMGVLNGTCNFILTEMEARGAAYGDILAEAQRLGYAEADPAFDVGGMDAAQKLALLAAVGFGAWVPMSALNVEGIAAVTLEDIRTARDLGFSIKLLGTAEWSGAALEVRMQPCLVPAGSALGLVESVTNMIVIDGDFVGQTVHEGPGAGSGPTASAVVADILDIAAGARRPTFGLPAEMLTSPEIATVGAPAAYYLRLALDDRPGTLAEVAAALGQHGVSIDQMRQTRHETEDAPVVMITHTCPRAAIDAALAEIGALAACRATPVAYRIETL